jgi:ribosome-binding factor A
LISYKVKWENGGNLIISVSVVTSDLSVATVHLSIFPQEKAKGL